MPTNSDRLPLNTIDIPLNLTTPQAKTATSDTTLDPGIRIIQIIAAILHMEWDQITIPTLSHNAMIIIFRGEE